MVDEPPEVTARLFETLAPQVLAGRTIDPGSTLDLANRTWAVLAVHPSHVRAGMMGWWEDIVPHCSCHSEPPAIQLVDIDVLRPADEEGGARLDRRFEPTGDRRAPRAALRRAERAEAKRRRRTGT